jgi:hypothetical protein
VGADRQHCHGLAERAEHDDDEMQDSANPGDQPGAIRIQQLHHRIPCAQTYREIIPMVASQVATS